MALNRKKLIDLFIGNLSKTTSQRLVACCLSQTSFVVFEHARKYTIIGSNIGLTSISHRLMVYFRHINAILHRILEKAIEDDVIRKYYDKEFLNSFEIAKKYREKINPINYKPQESSEIKDRIVKKVSNELKIRISKGYKNIDLSLVEPTADKFLSELYLKTKVIRQCLLVISK